MDLFLQTNFVTFSEKNPLVNFSNHHVKQSSDSKSKKNFSSDLLSMKPLTIDNSLFCGDTILIKVLKGITDDEVKLLDEFEDVEYDRKAVHVVLTDTSEKLQVGTKRIRICMANGISRLGIWKRHDKDGFITATNKFLEGRKLPEAKTRIDTLKTFFKQDIENGKPLDS
ncbi:unnamed protein product [Thlaspi arvense]|uniref:Uncharacterized protein n=1 Tax=Thlaspi arvense TaxID=13288 RepID=A0AAU9RJJ4_THLAR|nr:unnamed protein product [Thlaspi arvense]